MLCKNGDVSTTDATGTVKSSLCSIFMKTPLDAKSHQVKPIVETQEYMYFLYRCIHILTPRSQPPPLLSWFNHLNMIMYSPHMSAPRSLSLSGLTLTRTFVVSFLAFKSRNCTNSALTDGFPLKAKGSHIWRAQLI